jgi:hypothetical protein
VYVFIKNETENNAIFCLISTISGIQYGREELKKGSVDDRKLAGTQQRDYEVFADARASHCNSGACIFVIPCLTAACHQFCHGTPEEYK